MIDFCKWFFYNIILLQLILWTSFGFLPTLVFLCFPIYFHMDFLPMMFSRTSYIIWFFLWFPSCIFCRKSKKNTRAPPRKKKRDLIKNARLELQNSRGLEFQRPRTLEAQSSRDLEFQRPRILLVQNSRGMDEILGVQNSRSLEFQKSRILQAQNSRGIEFQRSRILEVQNSSSLGLRGLEFQRPRILELQIARGPEVQNSRGLEF